MNDDINFILENDLKKMLIELEKIEVKIVKENNDYEKKINIYKKMIEELIFENYNLCNLILKK